MQRVVRVESAETFLLKSHPPKVGVVAHGKVPASGWTNPELTPWFYIAPPADGIQDLDFVAEPPRGGTIILPVISPISAHTVLSRAPDDYWGKGRPLLGVRIHARENSIVAKLSADKPAEVQLAGIPAGAVDKASPYPWPWPWLTAFAAGGGDSPFPLKGRLPAFDLLGKTLRVYHTGDVLTQDHQPDRANIELSPATERIVDVWFG
jgi:hypothetical protein